MPSAYAYPGNKWEETDSFEAQALSGDHLDRVVRFLARSNGLHDVQITGRLAEVHHDRAQTTVLIDVTDQGDKTEYELDHTTDITLMRVL